MHDAAAQPNRWHVSSAVVAVKPGRDPVVVAALAGMVGVEVHAADRNRVVITIEGSSTGELGDRLSTIALMDGVIAANMVFELSEEENAST
jgi:periplasmic nitrate reductase NapD